MERWRAINQLKIIRAKILELETYLETKIIESKIPKGLGKRIERLPYEIYRKVKRIMGDLKNSRASNLPPAFD